MTTATSARDYVCDLIRDAWEASSVTEDLELLFDDTAHDRPKAENGRAAPAYGFVTLNHVGGGQTSVGQLGNRCFESRGVVTVNLFAPVHDGHTVGDEMAAVVLSALRTPGRASTVWFTEQQGPLEAGRVGPWTQRDVTASFTYREIA